MNEERLDQLRRELTSIAGGTLVSAEALLRVLDDPRLSIDQVRNSAEAHALRLSVTNFINWRVAAAAATKISYR